MSAKLNVAILIYDAVELVDMNGPIDTFLHANSYNGGRYNVFTVAETEAMITSEGGVVKMPPTYCFANCPAPDIIVIPGLIVDGYTANDAVVAWVKHWVQAGKTVMSVCVGAFTLAKTGLLNGRRATTHFLSIANLQTEYPGIKVVKNVRFMQDGHFISTGGITSGIDGALHLVEMLDGSVVAQQAADIMVYNRENPLPVYTLLPPYNSLD